jgi:hypothetical protein
MILLSLAISILGLVLLVFGSVILLILRDAMTKEAAAVIPERTRSLIERAKNRLPEEARPRWEEEWPAGFAEAIEKRPVWALREAISLYRGARRIAVEMEPAPATTSSSRRVSLRRSRRINAPRRSNRLRFHERWHFRLHTFVRRVYPPPVLIDWAFGRLGDWMTRVGLERDWPRVIGLLGMRLFFLGLMVTIIVKFQLPGL